MAVLNFDVKSVTLPSGDEAKAVFLSGSIDASTNQSFEGRLNDILSSGTNKVLLVLTNVKYINSTGLGTIVKCVDTFRESDGGDIKLVGVPTKVIALFEMLGLLALFETYETIEDAVSSFAETGTVAQEEPTVQFPIQFKHPITGMGLNVSQPGRFKDPRSGDYFSVDTSGKVEFYEINKVRVVDLKFPCDVSFSPALMAMANNLGQELDFSPECISDLERGVDEACSLIAKNNVGASESCHVLMVADRDKIQIGFVSHSDALKVDQNDPCYLAISQSMDDIKHQVLPTRGYLMTMIKQAA